MHLLQGQRARHVGDVHLGPNVAGAGLGVRQRRDGPHRRGGHDGLVLYNHELCACDCVRLGADV